MESSEYEAIHILPAVASCVLKSCITRPSLLSHSSCDSLIRQAPISTPLNRAGKMGKITDDDDSQSLHSLDLEEAKAMLGDNHEMMTYTEPTRRSRFRSCCVPFSITLNAVLFVFTLVILHNPCSFSSRQCQYETVQSQIIGESDTSGLKLMSEEHGFVPECM
jgi:hypothetical protein